MYGHLWDGKIALSATGSRMVAFEHMRYGRPTVATIGLFVLTPVFEWKLM